MPPRIGNVIVFVADMARARAFYVDVLGFRPGADSPHWIDFPGAAGLATLCLHPCDEPAPAAAPTDDAPRVQISFEVEGVRAAKRALEAKGVRFLSGVETVAPGRAFAKFRDPDGTELSIAGPP